MTGFEIFWPIMAHMFLVFLLYGLLRLRRRKLVREGSMTDQDIRLAGAEPQESRAVNKSIASQFELPMLFYACSILLYITEADSLHAVVLSWIFVISRYGHAYVHVTSNNTRLRFWTFITGFSVLFAMWAWLVLWMATS